MKRKLKWCFKIRGGAKIVKPSKTVSDSYIRLAKDSLKGAESMLDEGNLLWTTVMSYYAEYYALYSFLARVGIKCENHFCSILIAKTLFGKEKMERIERDRERRIDAQYYLRVAKKEKIKNMLNSAKIFVAEFEDITSNLDKERIGLYRKRIRDRLLINRM